jgi:hypothetical protein
MWEHIMIISIAVQAIATIVLAWVTYLLARHTKTLTNITEDLANIENVREARTKHEMMVKSLEEVYTLAEAICNIDPGYFGAGLYPGATGREAIALVKKLGLLINQIEDQQIAGMLHDLVRIIEKVEGGEKLEEIFRANTIVEFQNFQIKLRLHKNKWRNLLSD